jgi:UPF0716 family protein affecting phage T7 exclusion
VDGALILFAGALLVTPGVLTDAVGFSCLVPGTRALIKRQLKATLRRFAESGQVRVVEFRDGPFSSSGEPHDPFRAEYERRSRPTVRTGPRGPVVDVEAEPERDEVRTPNGRPSGHREH